MKTTGVYTFQEKFGKKGDNGKKRKEIVTRGKLRQTL